jgi:tetratricopeptide (TPR) repeat protein
MTTSATTIQQARALAKDCQFEAAFKLLDTLLQENPEDAEVWRTRAYVSDAEGNPQGAIHDITEAIARHDREPDYFFTRARYRMMCGEYRDAADDLTITLKLCDDFQSDYYREVAHLLRADCYAHLSMFREALSECQHVRDDATLGGIGRLVSRRDVLKLCEPTQSHDPKK